MADIWNYVTDLDRDAALVGYNIEATDGSVGKVDEATSEAGASYIVVDTGPWIFDRNVLLPAGVITSADHEEEVALVSRSKGEIKDDVPRVGPGADVGDELVDRGVRGAAQLPLGEFTEPEPGARTRADEEQSIGRIVVGIDASPDAERALSWALDEALLRGAQLELVHAYQTPELSARPMVVTLRDDQELRAAAESVLDDALKAITGAGDVEIIRSVRSGDAASVLTTAAEEADLLVVGARGLGEFRGLLLGCVSQQAVAQSPCPAVVVTCERH